MKNQDASAMALGAMLAVGFPAYLFLVCGLNAWVFTRLWDWYLVPAFGLAPLRIVFAFGIALIAHMLLATHDRSEDEREWYVKLALPILGPILTLVAGWIGTFWI